MDHTISPEVARRKNGNFHDFPELRGGCQTERSGFQRPADAVAIVGELATAYQISSIQPLLNSCLNLAGDSDLRIAVFGRFKAGKSSFLNHLLGRDILPVGVVPVTSVVTEIGYGPEERAVARYLDGRTAELPLQSIRDLIAEAENPGNRKRVALVSVELPLLRRHAGIRLVDTPGLESVFTHNTDASLSWLPNVGLAIVAIGVDPPLSQRDIELIRNLQQFTPKVSVLLTKVDILTAAERTEVETFVRTQLSRSFAAPPVLFSYSNRHGYEELRREVEDRVLLGTLRDFSEQRSAIVRHKIGALVRECEDYLRLALQSAQVLDSGRESLKKLVLGEKESLDEIKMQMKLLARNLAGRSRDLVWKQLESEQKHLERTLLAELDLEFPKWAKSLATVIESFPAWVSQSLAEKLAVISASKFKSFCEPLERLKKQLTRLLEDFRDRLSERAQNALGVSLGATDIEFAAEKPRQPDIRISQVFDRNWELISPMIPMRLFAGIVRRHLANRRAPYEVEKNLSRLTTQWEESVNNALFALDQQARIRLDELIDTVDTLLSHTPAEAPRIRSDLERLAALRSTSQDLRDGRRW